MLFAEVGEVGFDAFDGRFSAEHIGETLLQSRKKFRFYVKFENNRIFKAAPAVENFVFRQEKTHFAVESVVHAQTNVFRLAKMLYLRILHGERCRRTICAGQPACTEQHTAEITCYDAANIS